MKQGVALISLEPVIQTVEGLLQNGSEASLTYAALECRIAPAREASADRVPGLGVGAPTSSEV